MREGVRGRVPLFRVVYEWGEGVRILMRAPCSLLPPSPHTRQIKEASIASQYNMCYDKHELIKGVWGV